MCVLTLLKNDEKKRNGGSCPGNPPLDYRIHYCRHGDVIKWKHFPRYWPVVRGIHRSPVNSPHKGQWRGTLMFSLICVWINDWVNNREAGDLRRYRAHYDVTVMSHPWIYFFADVAMTAAAYIEWYYCFHVTFKRKTRNKQDAEIVRNYKGHYV